MVNSWSLLYDELYMKDDIKHSKYWYDYDRNDPDRPNPFVDGHGDVHYPADHPSQEFWHEDGFSMTGNPAAPSPDTINLSSVYNYINDFHMDRIPEDVNKIDLNLEATSKNGFWKYNEDKIMKEVRDYLSSTYRSHYTSKESQTQTLDLIESIGDAEAFCRSNAIKYLSRFGKKGGKSKLDITKAIHYCILLWHFSGLDNETKDSYETF